MEEFDKPFECKICGRTFEDSYKLDSHMDFNHQECSCVTCGQVFCKGSFLVKHLAEVHKDPKPHKCKMCGKAFAHRWREIEHR